MASGFNHGYTVRFVRNATKKHGEDETCERPRLKEDLVFCGENGTYIIHADQFLGIGGESQVYIANQDGNETLYAAKIYDAFADNAINRKNRKRINEFLFQKASDPDNHLMSLIDTGTIQLTNSDGEDDFVPVDILPYIPSGNIAKADYSALRNRIIPQILSALQCLHEAGIVHRDVKPGNIYELDGQVLLGDFGTASFIVNNELNTLATQNMRGTLGYVAPEVRSGYASPASDYYSFGCSIATIYCGKHVYQTLIDAKRASDVNLSVRKYGLPMGCPENEKDLQVLVDGLCQLDETERLRYEDVLLWLNDPKDFEQKFSFDRGAEDIFSFSFEGYQCTSRAELAYRMSENWDAAKDYAFQGGVEGSTLRSRLSQMAGCEQLSVNIGSIIMNAEDYDLGIAQIIHLIDPDGPMEWKGHHFDSLSSISDFLNDPKNNRNDVSSMLQSGYLSWKLNNTKNVTSFILEKANEIETAASEFPDMAAKMAEFCFTDDKNKQQYHGCATADELFQISSQSAKDFYRLCNTYITEDDMGAFLSSLGYVNNVLAFKRSLHGDFLDDVESVYLLFESCCADKSEVRKHYINFGPKSDLVWLRRNMKLYKSNSKKAEELIGQIERFEIHDDKSIESIARELLTLEEYVKSFREVFQGNPVIAQLGLGLSNGKYQITSSEPNAFFTSSFYGKAVPAGYKRYMSI